MFNAAERLKEIRFMFNLTQKEMADKIGVTHRTYQNYEYGCGKFLAADLYTLLEKLDISADFFFYRTDNMKAHKHCASNSANDDFGEKLDSVIKELTDLKVITKKQQIEAKAIANNQETLMEQLNASSVKIEQDSKKLRAFIIQHLHEK